MIHFSKCKISYPHDFEEYPCKKCNAFLMITSSGLMVKGKTINKRMIISVFATTILCIKTFIN